VDNFILTYLQSKTATIKMSMHDSIHKEMDESELAFFFGGDNITGLVLPDGTRQIHRLQCVNSFNGGQGYVAGGHSGGLSASNLHPLQGQNVPSHVLVASGTSSTTSVVATSRYFRFILHLSTHIDACKVIGP
jgi:hypothetical protein